MTWQTGSALAGTTPPTESSSRTSVRRERGRGTSITHSGQWLHALPQDAFDDEESAEGDDEQDEREGQRLLEVPALEVV